MGELGPTLVLLFERDWYNYETVQTEMGSGRGDRGGDRVSEWGGSKSRDRQEEGDVKKKNERQTEGDAQQNTTKRPISRKGELLAKSGKGWFNSSGRDYAEYSPRWEVEKDWQFF